MTLQQLNSPTLRLPILGVVVTALLLLGLTLPVMREIDETERANDQLRTVLLMQQSFAPLVATMKGDMAALNKPITARKGMEVPAPASIGDAITQLQQMATAAQLKGVRFVPLAESVLGNSNLARLDGTADGTLEAFRTFMQQTTSQPWLTRVEQVEITAGAQTSAFKMSIWIQTASNPKANGG